MRPRVMGTREREFELNTRVETIDYRLDYS